MKYDSALDIDGNFKAFGGHFPFKTTKRITFDGGTTGAIGDDGGAQDPFTIFTVTGDVVAQVFGVCKLDLVGSGTIAIGTLGDTTGFITTTTGTALDAGLGWVDNSPGAIKTLPYHEGRLIGNGADIIGTIGTADITAGIVDLYCLWKPLSSDGNVVAA